MRAYEDVLREAMHQLPPCFRPALLLCAGLCVAPVACSSTPSVVSAAGGPGGGSDAAVTTVTSPTSPTPPAVAGAELSQLRTYLVGDFDNAEQVGGGFDKLVERHLCNVPDRPSTNAEAWLYVEQVQVIPDLGRDAYFTRIVELRPGPAATVVSRAYKFKPTHPLYSNPSGNVFNGSRDGCTRPSVLSAIRDTDIIYRDGCDITYVVKPDGHFAASTTGTDCAFAGGGYIKTSADIFGDGLTTRDQVVRGGEESGDQYEFKRVLGWVVPRRPADAGTD